MIVRAVAKLEHGFLDLASLVPNAGGYEPDPIKRIHDSYCELRIPQLPPIDIETFFKKIPADFEIIHAEPGPYWRRYSEF